MFLQFFSALREAQLPVTLREYLTLMEALDRGLADQSVDEFYYLSRAALVKDERNLDKFDRVFGSVFKGLESLLDAMEKDSGVQLKELRVDGGMTANELLMQFQADQLAVPVIRPKVTETTALGAAYAAGLAVGFWKDFEDLKQNWQEDKRWEPQMDEAERERQYRLWKKAVTKTFDWVDEDVR